MNLSLYQAASALSATSRLQELIAENLAASATPGFKRHELALAAVDAGLLPASALNGTTAPQPFLLSRVQVSTDFTPGQMRFTGENTDVAIDGKAFFEVQLPDGKLGYTRDGGFQFNAQGQLVTKEGFPVLGENGPIQLDPNSGSLLNSLSISAYGDVAQDTESRGKLRIVEFNEPNLLTPATGGIYLAQHPTLFEVNSPTSTVRQRWLEAGNASPMTEMATLMTTMRSFEANQRALQLQDERLGRLISDLTPA
jgi:flagellar basal-body rod protein FlgG